MTARIVHAYLELATQCPHTVHTVVRRLLEIEPWPDDARVTRETAILLAMPGYTPREVTALIARR